MTNSMIINSKRYKFYHRIVPILPSSFSNRKMAYLQKASTPLFSTLPGSQNALFNFAFTTSGSSSKSILLSASLELIFAPVKPGTMIDNRCIAKWQTVKLTHWIHKMNTFFITECWQILNDKKKY